MKKDILKESLADAKMLKKIALENAKTAIQESITPHIMNTISSKINEEEEELDEELDLEETLKSLEEEEVNEYGLEHDPTQVSDEDFEIPGKKEKKEIKEEEEEIKLEDMSEDELKDLVGEVVDEMIASGEIEAGPNAEVEEEKAEEVNEEVNDLELDEILAEIDGIEESKKEVEEGKKKEMQELKEARKVISLLRNQLNEQVLLNSKLVYSTKLFRNRNLSENQIISILESFDKAKDTKQVKLIYETLTKNLTKKTANTNLIKESIKKGSASKSIVFNKPIIKEDDVFKRMQELAGL